MLADMIETNTGMRFDLKRKRGNPQPLPASYKVALEAHSLIEEGEKKTNAFKEVAEQNKVSSEYVRKKYKRYFQEP